jgi:peptidyl-prolyl cis-trans isomerase SurA
MKTRLKRFFLMALALGTIQTAFSQAQNDEVLMTIAGKKVTVGEFLTIYQKNNVKNEPIDQKSLTEYLDLFINFKLKVKEAEDLGLDTLTSFQTELAGYRDQLAKPYFTDEATIDRLVKEAYDRSLYDIRAAHIFVRLKPDALPEDTVKAFEKIMKVRARLNAGEDFGKVAMEDSEDPSARDRAASPQQPAMKGNHGDLGYFTVFDMVYAFETGAYTTEVGKFSHPVRTEYGYHIIKVNGKYPAMRKVTVAHLYLSIPKGATEADSARIHHKIDSVYQLLRNGGNWDELVKQYSDDKGSSPKGGVLPKFGVNRMVPEFIDAIYKMKQPGDYSEPILTSYGWHIVKLVEKDEPKPFDEEKNDLKQKVNKDGRSQLSRDVVLARIKTEYGFTEYPEALAEIYPIVTDSIFFGKWDAKPYMEMNKLLFKIGNMTFRQKDLVNFIATKQKKRDKEDLRVAVDKLYAEYVTESLIKWENAHLERKYPEFKALVGEYRDGILLFDLTDKKVWSKAVKDTLGLKQFYEKNRNNYMWDTRLDATIYKVTDPAAVSKVKNFIKSGLAGDAILKEINKDTARVLTIENGKFSRKDNKYIDQIKWEPGMSQDIKEGKETVFVNVKAVLKPEVKQLSEARGLITADYQNYLEKEWIRELRTKYPVVVNQEIFAKIK